MTLYKKIPPTGGTLSFAGVMSAQGYHHHPAGIPANPAHKAVLAVHAPRPVPGRRTLQPLRPADAGTVVRPHRDGQRRNPAHDLPVAGLPPEIRIPHRSLWEPHSHRPLAPIPTQRPFPQPSQPSTAFPKISGLQRGSRPSGTVTRAPGLHMTPKSMPIPRLLLPHRTVTVPMTESLPLFSLRKNTKKQNKTHTA